MSLVEQQAHMEMLPCLKRSSTRWRSRILRSAESTSALGFDAPLKHEMNSARRDALSTDLQKHNARLKPWVPARWTSVRGLTSDWTTV